MDNLESKINFHTRKWVKPEDLNPNRSLFGGRLLQWIDEEAVIYAIVQLENTRVVTKFISEINFINAPTEGDIIEVGIVATQFGRTSLTMRCEVRNMLTREPILTIEKLVFVNLDASGQPAPHGKTAISYIRDRLQIKDLPLATASNITDTEVAGNAAAKKD
ncbi:MAG TPA: hotdog domain-containing protein [Chitinophagaceae bacterium]|nr:hotdog domain-containing protein [Chitinophagaceae bacterium]